MAWNAKGILAGLLLVAASPLLAQASADNWDGLVRVRSDKIDMVFLAPEADFRPYTQVILDPSEMAMRANWLRTSAAAAPPASATSRPSATSSAGSSAAGCSSTPTSPKRSPRPASRSRPRPGPTSPASARR